MGIRAKTRTRGRDRSLGQTSFLDKWKARAKARRERLKKILSQPPGDAKKAEARVAWLRRATKVIVSRREWLEARLEHIKDLQTELDEALKGAESDGEEHPNPESTTGRKRKIARSDIEDADEERQSS